MARVFLSYRRADGRYAVGWIAERLRRLDEVTEVHTAFRDGELRCGDDFPAALAAEIHSCDVLVAVIGPNWHGRRSEGGHRIQDPDDWVGREITTALAAGKRVLPVLVGGVDPLSETDLSPALQPLVDLHSVSFDDAKDLEDLVDDLKSHLDDIDRAKALVAGLDAPISLPPIHFGRRIIALASLAAIVGALVGWGITSAFVGNSAEAAAFGENDGWWAGVAMVEVGLWAGLAVLGIHYFWHHFRGDIRVNWRPVLATLVMGGVLLGWVILAFGATTPIRFDAHRSWLLATLPLVLLAPWVVTATGTAWTIPIVGDHELGRRALVLGELGRAGRVSVAVLSVAAVPGVLSAGAIDHALQECGCGDTYQAQEVFALGAFLSMVFAGVAIWGRARLRQASIALAGDLRDLAPTHRRHANAHLVEDGVKREDWWVLAALATPLIASLAVVLWP